MWQAPGKARGSLHWAATAALHGLLCAIHWTEGLGRQRPQPTLHGWLAWQLSPAPAAYGVLLPAQSRWVGASSAAMPTCLPVAGKLDRGGGVLLGLAEGEGLAPAAHQLLVWHQAGLREEGPQVLRDVAPVVRLLQPRAVRPGLGLPGPWPGAGPCLQLLSREENAVRGSAASCL